MILLSSSSSVSASVEVEIAVGTGGGTCSSSDLIPASLASGVQSGQSVRSFLRLSAAISEDRVSWITSTCSEGHERPQPRLRSARSSAKPTEPSKGSSKRTSTPSTEGFNDLSTRLCYGSDRSSGPGPNP